MAEMTDPLRALVAKWRDEADAITTGKHATNNRRRKAALLSCADELEAALNAPPVAQFEGVDHAMQAMWGKDWEQFNDYGPSSMRAAYAAGARSVSTDDTRSVSTDDNWNSAAGSITGSTTAAVLYGLRGVALLMSEIRLELKALREQP